MSTVKQRLQHSKCSIL